VRVGGASYRTIWVGPEGVSIEIIDQTRLPDAFEVVSIETTAAMAEAIRTMKVRGAPLIGVAAAYGLCLASVEDASDAALEEAARLLVSTRPTAVNLRWAVDRTMRELMAVPPDDRPRVAYAFAARLADEDVRACERIGEHGANVLSAIRAQKRDPSEPLRVLTHCNAGWLATVDWGTALAPIYRLHEQGVPVEVWVDETRPRNQGYLTAWELSQHGVPNTVIADNAGGHYMQKGLVDVVIVGSDRTTKNGDVCNKIGTYLKALAARDNGVPFYAALPASTLDFSLSSGATIPIEMRDGREVHAHPFTRAENPAFDVTPARLVTGIITDRGVAEPNEASLSALHPELA